MRQNLLNWLRECRTMTCHSCLMYISNPKVRQAINGYQHLLNYLAIFTMKQLLNWNAKCIILFVWILFLYTTSSLLRLAAVFRVVTQRFSSSLLGKGHHATLLTKKERRRSVAWRPSKPLRRRLYQPLAYLIPEGKCYFLEGRGEGWGETIGICTQSTCRSSKPSHSKPCDRHELLLKFPISY